MLQKIVPFENNGPQPQQTACLVKGYGKKRGDKTVNVTDKTRAEYEQTFSNSFCQAVKSLWEKIPSTISPSYCLAINDWQSARLHE